MTLSTVIISDIPTIYRGGFELLQVISRHYRQTARRIPTMIIDTLPYCDYCKINYTVLYSNGRIDISEPINSVPYKITQNGLYSLFIIHLAVIVITMICLNPKPHIRPLIFPLFNTTMPLNTPLLTPRSSQYGKAKYIVGVITAAFVAVSLAYLCSV